MVHAKGSGMKATQSIRQLMQQVTDTLTPSERKLVRLLTGVSPAMALSTVQEFADKAGVSAPTVVRFAVKLGFSGFADFQRALVVELQSMLSSPLSLMAQGAAREDSSFGCALSSKVESAVANMPGLEAVLELLVDERRRVYLRGGRFSHFLALYAQAHLRQMRNNVFALGQSLQSDLDATLDIHKRDVVLLFDFRRYQEDTVQLGRYWAENGATVILFTDRWLSPATEYARHIFISEVATPSAFDSIVPAAAQLEYLIKCLLEKLGKHAAARLQRLEAIRTSSATWNGLIDQGPVDVSAPTSERKEE